ncbi:MAG: ORF6N domain-containing protein, partial [Yokenella regensburgei]|nr:ORF6N domain-containing protein [Yokenella regensburgei]
MPLVEYRGLRVVTFAMVDKAHQRPKDTARTAFKRNRRRFIEGVDYFIVSASEVDWGQTVYLARGIKHTGKKVSSHIRGKVTL